jgi:hypothetical protein
MAGVLIGLPLALGKAGGIAGLRDALPASYFDPGQLGIMEPLAWMALCVYSYATDQTYMQRVFAARDEKVARFAYVFTGVNYLASGAGVAGMGWQPLRFFPASPIRMRHCSYTQKPKRPGSGRLGPMNRQTNPRSWTAPLAPLTTHRSVRTLPPSEKGRLKFLYLTDATQHLVAKENCCDDCSALARGAHIRRSATRPTVLSLFTGAGGLDLGLEAAGFEARLCVEIDDDARATLGRNRPKWKLATPGDIHEHTPSDLLALAGLKPGEVDLLAGGPPCQPFSKSGYWRLATPNVSASSGGYARCVSRSRRGCASASDVAGERSRVNVRR